MMASLIGRVFVEREGDYEIWEETWLTLDGIQKYTVATLATEARMPRYQRENNKEH